MKSFKAFIKSWYYFLKEEKWVVRTFMVIAILIILAVNGIIDYLRYDRYDVFEYSKIKNYSSSFEIIAMKVYPYYEKEKAKIKSMRLSVSGDTWRLHYEYNNRTNRTEEIALNRKEKAAANNVNRIFGTKHRRLDNITINERGVFFNSERGYAICWFPNPLKYREICRKRQHKFWSTVHYKRINSYSSSLYLKYDIR